MASEWPSREITWEMGINAPELVMREIDAIDTKSMFAFATGTLIIAVFSTLSGQIRWNITILPFVLASVSFLIVLSTSIYILAVRKFAGPPDPEVLREDYWELAPKDAMEHLWQSAEDAFKTNIAIAESKGRALRYFIYALSAEVVLLIVWLALSPPSL